MTTCVVIGASIGGLTAAAAVADQFDHVLLLDRDELGDGQTPRRGAPQGGHGHVLLVSGARALETLFPGLSADLDRAGATTFADIGTDLSFHRYGTLYPPIPVGLSLMSLTRPRLEQVLRERVAARPTVTIRTQTAVSGLTGAGAGGAVTGVVLDDGTTVPADLVVDASGRGSRSDRWLAELGHESPASVEVKVGVTYSTRFYRRRPGQFPDGNGVLALPTPPGETRVGLVLPVEDDRWLVSVGGWHTAEPPGDPEAFTRFAEGMPYQGIAHLIRVAEPLTEVVTHRFPSSRRRLFERLPRPPAGYVATGDAICSFNPVYGQGMTCATLEALALRSTVDAEGVGSALIPRRFYRAAADIIATPWRFAVGGDFAFPATTGPRPAGVALFNAYGRRVQLAAQVSPTVRRVFAGVQQLVLPSSALFTPAVLAAVLGAYRRAPGRTYGRIAASPRTGAEPAPDAT